MRGLKCRVSFINAIIVVGFSAHVITFAPCLALCLLPYFDLIKTDTGHRPYTFWRNVR